MLNTRKKMIITRKENLDYGSDFDAVNEIHEAIGGYLLNGGDVSDRLDFMNDLMGILSKYRKRDIIDVLMEISDEVQELGHAPFCQ